jgi:hypothetical protein
MNQEINVTKIIRVIQNYLLIGLPFVLICMVWETIYPDIQFGKNVSTLTRLCWELLSINLMVWFIMLIVFLICMITMKGVREKTLRRLANLKERDEREQYIMGKAARATYISSLSLMILVLFFCMFSVRISTIPPVPPNNHHLSAGISLHFSLLNKTEYAKLQDKSAKTSVLFDSKEFSLSSSAIVLLLLGWQLLIFNYTARKEQDTV